MSDHARVLRVRAADGGAHLCLVIEAESEGEVRRETLTLCTARLTHEVCVGEIDARTLDYYRREHALATALAMGLRSLGAADCSEVQLARKLRQKGVAREVASEVTHELSERGLLMEGDAALRGAQRGVAKCWGNRRILCDLRAKGYGQEAIEAARDYLSGEDAVERCRRLLRKRGVTQPPSSAEEAKKLVASLMRYGYEAGEIRRAFAEEE